MTYVVLARKWRPQRFSELVGQGPIIKTLENAITLNRVSHAVLLTGSRGVGKTTTARILAKALNCEKGPTITACEECSNCKEITAGNCIDVMEVDGASNTKVDEIRELLNNVQYQPSKSKHKIYIIDEVHMLSTHSFNALLKTLEEPPPGVIFIFATTEPHKIPDTILSRCQRFDFRQISEEQIAQHLRLIVKSEKITIPDTALSLIARQAAGGLRDALSLLDQIIAFCGEKISEEDAASVLGLTDRTLLQQTLEAFVSHNSTNALNALSQVFAKGYDPRTYILELLSRVRDLLVLKIGASDQLIRATDDEKAQWKKLVEGVEPLELERWFDLLKTLTFEVGRSEFPQYVAEVAFIRITRETPRLPFAQLISRLEILEQKIGSGPTKMVSSIPVQPAAPVSFAPSKPAPVPTKLEVAPRKTETGSLAVESWEKLVTEVKLRKPAWAAILLQAAKAELKDGKVVLTYDEGSFYESRAKDSDFQTFLVELAQELFGGSYNVKIDRQIKNATASPASENRAREKQALENPVVQRAVSLFDARVEEVKPLK